LNLGFRRPAPYPLGHKTCAFDCDIHRTEICFTVTSMLWAGFIFSKRTGVPLYLPSQTSPRKVVTLEKKARRATTSQRHNDPHMTPLSCPPTQRIPPQLAQAAMPRPALLPRALPTRKTPSRRHRGHSRSQIRVFRRPCRSRTAPSGEPCDARRGGGDGASV
jgi:hypothetical protein